MFSSLRPVVLAVTLLAGGLVLSACTTTDPSDHNNFGTIETTVGAEPDRVTAAAESVLTELSLQDVEAVASKIDGKVTAQTAKGKDVVVNIDKAGMNMSKIEVRVGSMGNEAVSVEILSKIKAKLK